MVHNEQDYLLISGLQHLRFCPRQCALIHIEQLWRENFFTASGRVLHKKVHSGFTESRKTVRVERGLKIASSFLRLVGQTDAVEFYANGKVFPVEYKHGKPKKDTCDEVQLCAQAIALEEMLNCKINEGGLFYFKIRKRIIIPITEYLRNETKTLSDEFHELMESGITPKANYTRKCESCSFIDACFPKSVGRKKSVTTYLTRLIANAEATHSKLE